MHLTKWVAIGWFVVVGVARAEDWPGWLGPRRDGGTAEKVAPWSNALNVAWKQPVGEGHSSPIVADGIVYLHTKDRAKDQETLSAFDAKSGNPLWHKSYPRPAFKSLFGNGPRATPTVAGGKVFTFGITGMLTCFDAKSGDTLWQVDTLKKFSAANLFFGASCSPLVDADRLYLNVGGKGASLVAFDVKNGNPVWQALDDKASYASPILIDRDSQRQLIFLTGVRLLAVDPKDGKLLWDFPFKDALAESSTTPVLVRGTNAGDILFGSSITLGSVGLKMLSGARVEKAWLVPELTCYFSTPVAVGKDLYLVAGTKPPALFTKATLRCIDPTTGKERWSRDKVGRYHASLLRTGDAKLLLLEEAGDLVLLEPDPTQYRELARSKVCGNTWAHPAIANGRFYIRDDHELRCIELVK